MSEKRPHRLWTGAELKRASLLWKAGNRLDQIAFALDRSKESVKHQVERRRDLFPRRNQARSEVRNDGDVVPYKFTLSKFLAQTIAREAARSGKSQCWIIRDALRDRFLRKSA